MKCTFLAVILFSVLVLSFFLNSFAFQTAESQSSENLLFKSRSISPGKTVSCLTNEIVIMCSTENENKIVSLKTIYGIEEFGSSSFTSIRLWRLPTSRSIEEWLDVLRRNPLVDFIEPNYMQRAFSYPNDPAYQYQWNFDDNHTINPSAVSFNPYGGINGGGIRMEDAWSITNGSLEVVVGVIDTGVSYENYPIPKYEQTTVKSGVSAYQKAPDLGNTSFWVNDDEIPGNQVDDDGNGFVDDVNGWDFVNQDAHPNDNNGHGTHVTGTIAQSTGNALGAAGIAQNTVIMPIKVLDYSGSGNDFLVSEGIYYAVDNGAKIINLSLGGSDFSTTLRDAVAYAYDHGVVVVAASGNDGLGSVSYPAAYDNYVIAVGATRYDETRVSYSNYGSSLDLVAPGGDIDVDQNEDGFGDGIIQQTFKPYNSELLKADPTDWTYYYFFEGTSMATPHVAGVAALVLSENFELNPDQVRYALETTAEDLGNS